MLESAINRPFATFDHIELYPDPKHKAAALLESIVVNHPFHDGNKRTSYVVFTAYPLSQGIKIIATEDEKYKLVIGTATGEIDFNGIVEWLGKFTEVG